MDKYNVNFSVDDLTLAQQQEMFKNIDMDKVMQNTMPNYIKNSQSAFDNIQKSNPVVEELKFVKSELQNQTKELEHIHYQNEKLNAQLKIANITIDEQSDELTDLRKINEQLIQANETLKNNNKHYWRNTILISLCVGVFLFILGLFATEVKIILQVLLKSLQ